MLVHRGLQSRFGDLSELQKAARAEEVVLAIGKLLWKEINVDKNFSDWRFSEVSELCSVRSECALNARVLSVPSDHLASFSYAAAFRSLHEYMGYLPEVDPSNAIAGGHNTGSIVILSSLDALIATTISCLRNDGIDKLS